ncbi:hypothetical protein Cgig2_028352 [Carnegiea gigantea]|uniref:Uncharacterized protein n=1 Tax=Carnegiea gigantea TaxID=171969 RepID=A0A9Q1QBB2_9CARY|nr:hypothetical protein Cgig2_028352 [Carnegiea gigantea]
MCKNGLLRPAHDWGFKKDKLFDLFTRVAFPGGHQLELENIGKQIAEIRPSVPLVIRTRYGEKDDFGHTESFRMHNLIHDLAPSVSGLNYRMLDSHSKKDEKVVFERGPPPSLLKDKEKMQSLLADHRGKLQLKRTIKISICGCIKSTKLNKQADAPKVS